MHTQSKVEVKAEECVETNLALSNRDPRQLTLKSASRSSSKFFQDPTRQNQRA